MNNQKRIIAFSVLAAAIPSFWMGAAYSNQPAQAFQAVTVIERVVCLPGQGLGNVDTIKPEPIKPTPIKAELVKPMPSATPEQAPKPMPSMIIIETREGVSE